MKFECAYKELLNIDDPRIIENPENNNKHSEEQITRLAKIISYQGQRSPIVISTRSGFITKGHARFRAIKKLKWSKIAVDFQDYENEAQEYADMTADNAIALWAEFDLVSTETKMQTLNLDHDLLGIKDFQIELCENTEKLTHCLEDRFLVLIDCKNEKMQAEIFKEMTKRAFECKLMS